MGRKPSKQNLSQGSPEDTMAGMQAVAPGSVLTLIPSSAQARASRNPGSLMPGVQRNVGPRGYLILDYLYGTVLVELVMGQQFAAYSEVLEQNRTGSCVLRKNDVCLTQHLYGPDGHILKIAYGRRHYVEYSG